MAGGLSYSAQGSLLGDSFATQGGAAVPGSNTTDASNQSQQSTYYANPAIAGSVSSNLANLINKNSASYDNFVSDPTSHPAFINSLQGMLAAMAPSENLGRRNLADVYRAAGNTASSTYAKGAAWLKGKKL